MSFYETLLKYSINFQKLIIMNIISAFVGAGGLDIGLESAGFNTVACLEIDPSARATIEKNRDNWNLLENGDIFENTTANILNSSGKNADDIFMIAGGPPCQPFSTSANWANGSPPGFKDPRGDTIDAYLKLVDEIRPEVVLIENVKGFLKDGFPKVSEGLNLTNDKYGTNYFLQYFHVNAAEYGVPQVRNRVFFIAHRSGKEFVMPEPTHDNFDDSKPDFIGTYDAFMGLENELTSDSKLTGKWANLIPSIPEGENYMWHTNRKGGRPLFGWRTRYWNFLLKLHRDKPSWTIQASPGPSTGPFHWDNRKLTIPELKRLQTFPDSYEIEGSYRDAVKQIGNAVPPAIGEMIGLEIRRQFLGQDVRSNLELIPNHKRSKPISPLKLKRVPKEYSNLLGKHDDHPGHGLGPGIKKVKYS